MCNVKVLIYSGKTTAEYNSTLQLPSSLQSIFYLTASFFLQPDT